MTLARGMLGVVGAVILLPFAAPAQSTGVCSPTQASSTAVAAGRAIDAWEARRSVMLTDGVRTTLINRLCQATIGVATELDVDPKEVAGGMPGAVSTFLDEVETGRPSRSLESLLASPFSLNSRPAPPEPLPLGRIHIIYARQADQIVVGGTRMAAYSLVLADSGETSIVGMLRGKRVCGINGINVRPMETSEVQC